MIVLSSAVGDPRCHQPRASATNSVSVKMNRGRDSRRSRLTQPPIPRKPPWRLHILMASPPATPGRSDNRKNHSLAWFYSPAFSKA